VIGCQEREQVGNGMFHITLQNAITPLHVAAKWGTCPMIVLLLEHNANIECRTRVGKRRCDILFHFYSKLAIVFLGITDLLYILIDNIQ